MKNEIKIYNDIEIVLKEEYGSLWDNEKDYLLMWATLYENLRDNKCEKREVYTYLEAGIRATKVRLANKLQENTINTIVKVLIILLKQLIKP